MDKETSERIMIREAALSDLGEIVKLYNQGIEDENANCELGCFTVQERLEWFNNHQGGSWIAYE